MEIDAKIYVAGHNGLVGSSIIRRLRKEGYRNIITKTHYDLDLVDQHQVKFFFEVEKPNYVFMAAARVGGILDNHTRSAEFIYNNLQIECNTIHYAYINGVSKFLLLGSNCIYPKDCEQPVKEEYLMGGPLEKTNEPYAVAKIAGIKMCQAYRRQYGWDAISAMPINMYGPGDNFDLSAGHVLPSLLHRFHIAKVSNDPEVIVWGSGKPYREFMYCDDLADALILVMNNYSDESPINIGSGKDITICDLAILIKSIVGYKGDIVFDNTKPDGTYRKLLEVSKLSSYGWKPKIDLRRGLENTYRWFVDNYSEGIRI